MSWHDVPVDDGTLPGDSGSYILEFRLARPVELDAGRFEGHRVGPGRVRYYGSARGPGGIAARVNRHLDDANETLHWHIDYLTSLASVDRVYVEPGADECELVERDRRDETWQIVVSGFGATDCASCDAHLLVRREDTHE